MPSQFPTSTFLAPSTHTYHYIHISNPPNRYILILHGWPSIPTDFISQITHLSSLGYSIIAPYLLGYHPTSAPRSLQSYTLKSMADDLAALIESLPPNSNQTSADHNTANHSTTRDNPFPIFAAISHDWGSTLLSRLNFYYPNLVQRLAYLTVGPVPFGQEFDLEKVNEMSREMVGYEALGYQKFLISEGAARKLETGHERFEKLMFARDMEVWKRYVGRVGGVKEWLAGDEEVEMIEMKKEDMEMRRKTFVGRESGEREEGDYGAGYAGSVMWYHAHVGNVNVEDERGVDGWEEYRTEKKTLLVTSGRDPIAIPAMHVGFAQSSVKEESQLTVKGLDAGHFVMYECAEELNEVLEEWLSS